MKYFVILLFGIVSLTIPLYPQESSACSCIMQSTNEALEDSVAVFSGKVTKITEEHPTLPMISSADPVTVEFQVDRVWKGSLEKTIKVTTASDEGTCGYGFEMGKTYLVYSYETQVDDPLVLKVSLCSRTAPIADASEDLSELGIGKLQNESTMELKDEKRAMGLERETMTTEMQEKSTSGGCLIATATYGTELAPQVQQLRELRDNSLLQTNSGSAFMTGFNQLYYSFSPTIADWERQNPIFKETVKLAITPLITSLTVLNYVDMDSEQEVLGYGIGMILLNIGMYFVVPALVILGVKRKI